MRAGVPSASVKLVLQSLLHVSGDSARRLAHPRVSQGKVPVARHPTVESFMTRRRDGERENARATQERVGTAMTNLAGCDFVSPLRIPPFPPLAKRNRTRRKNAATIP